MRLVTFIDGNAKTRFGTLSMRHSPSVTVIIKKEHQAVWEQVIGDLLADIGDDDVTVRYPTDNGAPVPVVFSTSDLSDFLTNFDTEDWYLPYKEDLLYMTDEDQSGMGVVYLLE